MRKSTLEERLLGLDPSKYTQKSWNPNKYAGSGGQSSNPMNRLADEMRLKAEQSRVLEPEGQSLSPEQAQEIKKQMVLKMMGDPFSVEKDKQDLRNLYSLPEKRDLIRELGLDLKDGIPVLDEEDEEKFQKSIDMNEKEIDRRSQMLLKLLTHE